MMGFAIDLPDLVNGSFEILGAAFIALSVRKAYLDKRIAGVSYVHAAFFSIWGLWNLFYYPHLDQMLSFYGGLAIMSVNAFWLGQLIYYSKYPGGRKEVCFDIETVYENAKVYPACPRKYHYLLESGAEKVIVLDSLTALYEFAKERKDHEKD